MARPITWRNIAAPSFNASGINAATGAFRSAGEGFRSAGDAFLGLRDQENEYLTNQAISAALSGGSISGDPRVDAERLQQALRTQQIDRSNLATATLEQAGLRTENAQARLDLEQDPAEHAANVRALGLAGDADAARIREANLGIDIAEEEREQARVNRKTSQELDNRYSKRVEELHTQYKEQNMDTVRRQLKELGLTDVEIDNRIQNTYVPQWRANAEAQAALEIPSMISQTRLANPGATDAAILNTFPGRAQNIEIEAAAEQAQVTDTQLKALGKRQAGYIESAVAANGDTTGVILDNGQVRIAANEAERKGNTFGGRSDIKATLGAEFGLDMSTDDLDDAEEVLSILGGNKGYFLPLVQEQIDSEFGLNPFAGLSNLGPGKRTVNWKEVKKAARLAIPGIREAAAQAANVAAPSGALSNADILQSLQQQVNSHRASNPPPTFGESANTQGISLTDLMAPLTNN